MKKSAVVALIFLAGILIEVEDLMAKGNRETKTVKPMRTLDLSKFDKEVVKQFQNAWHVSKCGTSNSEGVVLIYRMLGGFYKAKFLGESNEFQRFTFTLDPAAIAIVHTHPNICQAQPSADDMEIADKFGLLMFTITAKGMYVYDPFTRKTTKLMDGIEWLDAAKWTGQLATRMAGLSPSFMLDLPQRSLRDLPIFVGMF
ncbi:MAG: hypothetical protein AB1757_29210 [Acidobacteriota bacterium]